MKNLSELITKHEEIYGDQSQRITSVPTMTELRMSQEEKRKKQKRDWYHENREKVLEQQKNWKKKKQQKEWYANNKVQQIDKAKKWNMGRYLNIFVGRPVWPTLKTVSHTSQTDAEALPLVSNTWMPGGGDDSDIGGSEPNEETRAQKEGNRFLVQRLKSEWRLCQIAMAAQAEEMESALSAKAEAAALVVAAVAISTTTISTTITTTMKRQRARRAPWRACSA